MRLVLASASPRRAELLASAGYAFEIRAVDVDEQVKAGEGPDEYVRRLASEKSAKAHHCLDDDEIITLGADTAVVIDGVILGKPADEQEVGAMLRRLAGRTHEVLTGISVRHCAVELTAVERTAVEFAPLRTLDIDWYVQTREGVDKAGGYAIQGRASRFIPRIHGSYSNVVGLPIAVVAELLAQLTVRERHLASPG